MTSSRKDGTNRPKMEPGHLRSHIGLKGAQNLFENRAEGDFVSPKAKTKRPSPNREETRCVSGYLRVTSVVKAINGGRQRGLANDPSW